MLSRESGTSSEVPFSFQRGNSSSLSASARAPQKCQNVRATPVITDTLEQSVDTAELRSKTTKADSLSKGSALIVFTSF